MNEEQLRRRRRLRRQQQRKRRRRIFYILCILFLVIIFTILRGIVAHFSRTSNHAQANVALWYIQQMDREKSGDPDRSNVSYASIEELSNIARDKLTTFGCDLVKNSNHIKSAEKYAYSTKKIREITEGKLDYTGKKIAFLTFDDGPNNTITPQVLDTLKDRQVPATFFLVGRNLGSKHEDTLRRILREGHGIAMHSLSHDYSKLYPGRFGNAQRIRYEAQETQKLLKEFFGPDFHSSVWRYPGGHQSWKELEASDDALAKLGVQWIDWNCLVGDAQPRSDRPTTSEGQVQYVHKSLKLNKQTRIAVVLAHDAENKQLTADSLDKLIDYFKDNGYEFGILK